MKKYIVLLWMTALSTCLYGQSLERYVIASAGGSYYNGINLQMDYTVGELAVTTLNNSSNIMTQGFQQPFASTVLAVAENPDDPFQSVIYPNPFNDELNIMISDAKEDGYYVLIFDVIGQLIKTERTIAGFDGKARTRFDLNSLSTGTYFIRVMHDQKVLLTRKVVKVNQ